MPKISVVIPIYNAEAFLKSSLDSVLSQSIGDLEVLCTDDGSSDSSLAILKEYAQKDPRVRYFCQENKGAGPARNLALSNARGEFVVFMDGDDSYPEINTLELLYNAAVEHNCDVVAGYRSMLTEKGIHVDAGDPLYKLAQENPNGLMLSYRDVQFDFNYQCYCFRHSLLLDNDITFPDYRRCQDPPFLVRAMIAAEKFYLLPITSYQYRWGHQNIQWNKRKINDLLKAHIDLLTLSRGADFDKLHRTVASRVERKYKNVILSCLNGDNLELVALLVYANSITDYEWLQKLGDRKRKSNWYESVTELTGILPDVLTMTAGLTNRTLSDLVEEIYSCFEQLPGANSQLLDDVMLVVLAALYDQKRPHYIRSQLAKLLATSRYEEICAGSSDSKESADAKKLLEDVRIGSAFSDRLQVLKDESVYDCRCVHDSRQVENPRVSVIVPVYNVEKYLEECLDSLLNQSCKDLEVICVNDGSTDSSLDIAMRYATANPNFIVLNQNNSGLSVARNSGLKYARGSYIHFLDSDDFMDPASYEKLLEKAEANDLDMLFFDAESYYEDEALRKEFPWYETGYQSKSSGDALTDGAAYFINSILQSDFRISACMYLVRKEFLDRHNIRFLEGIVHEDNYFTYACAMLSQRTSHFSAPFYGRRVCRGSITIRDKKFRHAYGYFRSYIELRNFVDHTSLAQSIKDVMSLKLMDMLKNARNEYKKISDASEQQMYLALPAVESEQFYLMVADPALLSNASISSVSGYNLKPYQGVPHQEKQGGLIRRGLKCCRDHGVVYTFRHTLWKVKVKIRRGMKKLFK